MRHKHADLIKEWIEDTSIVIQIFYDGKWVDINGDPSFYQSYEYRKKPATKKYKTALVKHGDDYLILAITKCREESYRFMEEDPTFVRWEGEELEVEI